MDGWIFLLQSTVNGRVSSLVGADSSASAGAPDPALLTWTDRWLPGMVGESEPGGVKICRKIGRVPEGNFCFHGLPCSKCQSRNVPPSDALQDRKEAGRPSPGNASPHTAHPAVAPRACAIRSRASPISQSPAHVADMDSSQRHHPPTRERPGQGCDGTAVGDEMAGEADRRRPNPAATPAAMFSGTSQARVVTLVCDVRTPFQMLPRPDGSRVLPGRRCHAKDCRALQAARAQGLEQPWVPGTFVRDNGTRSLSRDGLEPSTRDSVGS